MRKMLQSYRCCCTCCNHANAAAHAAAHADIMHITAVHHFVGHRQQRCIVKLALPPSQQQV